MIEEAVKSTLDKA